MKKLTKRLISLALVLAMLVVIVPVTNAQAATSSNTESLTLYVGESLYWTNYLTVNKVSSSDKTVVKATIDPDYGYRVDLTPKKVGSAKITVKTSYGTYYLKIKVKKLKVKASLMSTEDGYLFLKVKNKTSQTFDDVYVKCTLRDADGNKITSGTIDVDSCVVGKTVYDCIYHSNGVDISKSTVKVVGAYHDPYYTYTNMSGKKKLTVKTKESTDSYGNTTLTITTTNKKKKTAYGYNFVVIYDADNSIIGLECSSLYLSGGNTVTDTAYILSDSYPNYDHYKVKTVAYSYTY